MKLQESMFPIVIYSKGANSNVTFNDKDNGFWDSGKKTGIKFEELIELGEVKAVGGNEFPIVFSTNIHQNITFSSLNDGVWDDGSKTGLKISHFFKNGNVIVNSGKKSDLPTYQECAIEDMPLGAKLLGYYNTDGEFVELTFRPRVIEVHDNCICLLMHFHHKGDGVDGEASFLRNRKIRYEK